MYNLEETDKAKIVVNFQKFYVTKNGRRLNKKAKQKVRRAPALIKTHAEVVDKREVEKKKKNQEIDNRAVEGRFSGKIGREGIK